MTTRGFRSLLAVLDAGFEPVGVAMGAVAFQMLRPGGCRGVYGAAYTTSDPVVYPTYEQALFDTWTAAVTRLEAEAVRLGAHGVVGVTVKQEWLPGAPSVLQFQLTGSAVRVRTVAPLARPFLSMLSMEQTLKLLLRGWVPCGVAFGVAAIHIHKWGSSAFWQGNTFTNAEMASPTAGMQLARSRAQHGFRQSLASCKADGAVGARVELSNQTESCGGGRGMGMRLEGRMVGTGVVRFGAAAVPVDAYLSLAGSKR